MIDRSELGSTSKVRTLAEWESVFRDTERYGTCGLHLITTGQDPLSYEVELISLTLPNNIAKDWEGEL